MLGRQITIEHFLDVLPDAQRVDDLHVGKAIEKDDAGHELVGVLHLLDRFLAPLLGERLEAPVVEQAIVQPVLVDGRELMPQTAVEILDDFRVALHVSQSPFAIPFSQSLTRPRSPRPAALWTTPNLNAAAPQ